MSALPVWIVYRVKAEEYERRSKKQVELKEPTGHEDISALRETDMFAYYSISSIRTNALALNDITSPSSNASSDQVGSSQEVHRQCRKRLRKSNFRRTCVSVEAHPIVVLEGLIEESTQLGDD